MTTGGRVVPWPALIPRVMCLVWAIWSSATAYAYRWTTPDTLNSVEDILHFPIWIAWAVVSGVLVVGALIPPRVPRPVLYAGSTLRLVGMSLVGGLVTAWAFEFILDDSSRGWVSGKNYLLLAFCAVITAGTVAQNRLEMLLPTALPEHIEPGVTHE